MYPSITFFGFGEVSTYFLLISLAFVLAIFWLRSRARRYEFNELILYDLCLRIMIGAFLGARLLHVLYEMPKFYLEYPWEILSFWKGGFVFYGGFFVSMIWGWIFLRRRGEDPRRWLDLFAPVLPLGYAIGRFATLLSGSGYGKPTDLPWAILFPPGVEAPPNIPLHPTQIYAVIVELLILMVVLILEKRRGREAEANSRVSVWQRNGAIFFQFLILHGSGRILIETFRSDERGGFLLGESISTWISILLIFWAGIELYLFNKRQSAN